MSVSAPVNPNLLATTAATGTTLATATSGKAQQQQTAQAKEHTPNLDRYYKRKLPAIHVMNYSFELTLRRPRQPDFPLDGLVEELTWQEDDQAMTASVTLHRPDAEDPSSLPIARGQTIRCRVRWEGQVFQLWEMRVGPPQITKEDGTVQVDLADDLARLKRDKRDWTFRATKQRPHGWTAAEVTRQVAKDLGLKVGELAKCKKRFSLTKRKSTAFDVVTAAWDNEKKSSGKKYVIRLRNGKLEAVELKRNPIVYAFKDLLMQAAITQKDGQDFPTTVIEGHAKIGKGHGSRKVKYLLAERKVISRYGYSKEEKDYGTVKSMKELRDNVKRDLAAKLQMNDTTTITHPGIPFIRRGDSAELIMPEEGYGGGTSYQTGGKYKWVWANRVTHTVHSNEYTTEIDFTFTDVYLQIKFPPPPDTGLVAGTNGLISGNATAGGTGSGPRWLVTASQESDGGPGACGDIGSGGIWYSELSTSPNGTGSDFAALGNLPCMTPMVITNPQGGQSVTAQKRDKGAGSSFLPVMGIYPATAGRLGVGGGEYHLIIQRADGGALKPVRGTPA